MLLIGLDFRLDSSGSRTTTYEEAILIQGAVREAQTNNGLPDNFRLFISATPVFHDTITTDKPFMSDRADKICIEAPLNKKGGLESAKCTNIYHDTSLLLASLAKILVVTKI